MLQTLYQSKIAQSAAHQTSCQLCEHHCGVDRSSGERGKCHATDVARVFRHRIEYGEESELIPSHLFYTSGCDLRCTFCIAEANAFNPAIGTLLTPQFLKDAIAWGQSQGAINVQFVGGEPTIHLPAIIRALAELANALSQMPKIVWKSDFYGSPAAFELLDGIADVFVADFKFGNDVCAKQVAKVDRYLSVVKRNLISAQLIADLIVRHLLLPGHFECCYRPIVAWMAENMPTTKFSLRDGYLPRWSARNDPMLGRVIDAGEAKAARDLARGAGLNLVI